MRFGIADYGMNVWDGGSFDVQERLARLKDIGYEGLERCHAVSEADAVHKAAVFRRLGMDFATVSGPSPAATMEWTAAFGKAYVWTMVTGKDFDTFCRQVNTQVEAAERWGVALGHARVRSSMVGDSGSFEEITSGWVVSGHFLFS